MLRRLVANTVVLFVRASREPQTTTLRDIRHIPQLLRAFQGSTAGARKRGTCRDVHYASPDLTLWRGFAKSTRPQPDPTEATGETEGTKPNASGQEAAPDAAAPLSKSPEEAAAEEAVAAEATTEPSTAGVEELQAAVQQKDEQIADLQDRVLRTLAEMENLRDRTTRHAQNAQKFAVQGFAKSLLDVADNLERAADAVPALQHTTPDEALRHLQSLLEGVRLTERILLQVFERHGLQRYKPLGEKFDPNLHEALFELPDPKKEPGTVGAVTKTGYMLHGRVVRPAEVGVVKAR